MRITDEQFNIFKKTCKLYFSSLSARGAQFAYFNIPVPCDLVLSNSTSPRPNKKPNGTPMTTAEIMVDKSINHGDRVTNYSVTDLSIHLLNITDVTFIRILRHMLKIPETGYYVVNVVKFTSMLNNVPRNEIEIYHDRDLNLIMAPKGTRTIDPNKHWIGHIVQDYHVVSRIRYCVDIAHDTITEDHREEYPRIVKTIEPSHISMNGRLFFIDIDTWEYVNDDESLVFPNSRPTAHVLCLDGLSCVSIKEFIPKVKKTKYIFDMLTWAVESAYILAVTRFTNEDITVLSFRPNIVTFPCPNLAETKIDLGTIDTVSDE